MKNTKIEGATEPAESTGHTDPIDHIEEKPQEEPVMNPHEAITTGLAEARREHVKVPMEQRMPRSPRSPGSRMEPHNSRKSK